MGTVAEKIQANRNRAAVAVVTVYGNGAGIEDVQDLMTDLMHLAQDLSPEPDSEPGSSSVADALHMVEVAIGHFMTESAAAERVPDEDEDILGAYTNPYAHIAVVPVTGDGIVP